MWNAKASTREPGKCRLGIINYLWYFYLGFAPFAWFDCRVERLSDKFGEKKSLNLWSLTWRHFPVERISSNILLPSSSSFVPSFLSQQKFRRNSESNFVFKYISFAQSFVEIKASEGRAKSFDKGLKNSTFVKNTIFHFKGKIVAEENAINMFCQLNKKSNFSILTFKAVFSSSFISMLKPYFIFSQKCTKPSANVNMFFHSQRFSIYSVVLEGVSTWCFSTVFCVPCLSQIALSLISFTSFVNVTKYILSDLPKKREWELMTRLFSPLKLVAWCVGLGFRQWYLLFVCNTLLLCMHL